ncbi:MAG: hypothetical protein Q4F83_10890 [Eubacteriales bacterium]|nr:hypothetical protein [Eubacteriales bacterium]
MNLLTPDEFSKLSRDEQLNLLFQMIDKLTDEEVQSLIDTLMQDDALKEKLIN